MTSAKAVVADRDEELRIINQSGLVNSKWYLAEYPDVGLSGLKAPVHYLRYGAEMGRNPSKRFDTRYYLAAYPDVGDRGMNPLVHYLVEGRDKGYLPHGRSDPLQEARNRILQISTKLYGLGLRQESIAELARLRDESDIPEVRAQAARELALWHMRTREPEGSRIALGLIETARQNAPRWDFRCKLSTMELLCHHFLDDFTAAMACYERAAQAGEMSPDTMLAWVNFQPTPEMRCVWINQVLKQYGITPVGLTDDECVSLYDRLTSASPLPAVTGGPKVTVLLAAYKAAAMIPTALRALQEQTWKNLEILVIDDCSPDDTCDVVDQFAAQDYRIRLIRMERNGGAYLARNRGLDEATGDFVTIHDADDWSHPLKIETQVRFLQDNPEVMGCTSEQARALDDLSFTNIRRNGGFIIFNTSSFMFRRAPIQEALGYWDTVRFGADNELIRRMQKVFGKGSFRKLPTGPLSFQRDAESSVTSDPITGIAGGYYGVRREYFDGQRHHHANRDDLRYTNDPARRPFAAPVMMRPEREIMMDEPRVFDLIVYGDFRTCSDAVAAFLDDLPQFRTSYRTIGLVERFVYDAPEGDGHAICAELRKEIDGTQIHVLVYGDTVKARKELLISDIAERSAFEPLVHRHTA